MGASDSDGRGGGWGFEGAAGILRRTGGASAWPLFTAPNDFGPDGTRRVGNTIYVDPRIACATCGHPPIQHNTGTCLAYDMVKGWCPCETYLAPTALPYRNPPIREPEIEVEAAVIDPDDPPTMPKRRKLRKPKPKPVHEPPAPKPGGARIRIARQDEEV